MRTWKLQGICIMLAVGSMSGAAWGASGLESCDRKIVIDDAFNTTSHIRVDQAFICVNEGMDRGVLIFRASAMTAHSYPTLNHAPWVRLYLYNRYSEVVWSDETFIGALVGPCGGYHGHAKPISARVNFSDVEYAEIHMPGSDRQGAGCGRPGGFAGIVQDLQASGRRYLRGDFTQEEQSIIKLIAGSN